MKPNRRESKRGSAERSDRVRIRELPCLYKTDEIAWLESMHDTVKKRRYDELDYKDLSAYLGNVVKGERQGFIERLTALLYHLLLWEHSRGRRPQYWAIAIDDLREGLQVDASRS